MNKGDIVIVHDDTLPRGHWKLGKIQEVYVGKDGLPRSALVKLATRDRQHTLLKRPLQLLYPLEVHHDESLPEPQVVPEPEIVPGMIPEPKAKKRPTRATAKKARAIWMQELEDD